MSTDRKDWTGERLETWIFSENTNEHLHRYAMAMELCRDKKVLDIACGEGYGSKLLRTVAAVVTGVDIDAQTVENARKKYSGPGLDFLTGSAAAIPLPDAAYDVVVSFETIEHHDQHEEMMQEIRRVLRPGGVLIISSPDKKYYSDVPGYKNPFHVKELYKQEFEALIKNYFKHTRFYSQRSFTGSVVIADNDQGSVEPKMYEGSYEALATKGMEALYSICIASDEPLAITGANSLFNGADVLKAQFKELEDYVRGTTTEQVSVYFENAVKSSDEYRLGNALLKRLPFLKKFL